MQSLSGKSIHFPEIGEKSEIKNNFMSGPASVICKNQWTSVWKGEEHVILPEFFFSWNSE